MNFSNYAPASVLACGLHAKLCGFSHCRPKRCHKRGRLRQRRVLTLYCGQRLPLDRTTEIHSGISQHIDLGGRKEDHRMVILLLQQQLRKDDLFFECRQQ